MYEQEHLSIDTFTSHHDDVPQPKPIEMTVLEQREFSDTENDAAEVDENASLLGAPIEKVSYILVTDSNVEIIMASLGQSPGPRGDPAVLRHAQPRANVGLRHLFRPWSRLELCGVDRAILYPLDPSTIIRFR